MKLFLGEIHFENKSTWLNLAIQAPTLKEAKEMAQVEIGKSLFKNHAVKSQFWKSTVKKVVTNVC